MAETLGSLVDKLTIKEIRQFHLEEMIEKKDTKFSKSEIEKKLNVLKKQISDYEEEIDCFVLNAFKNGNISVRDEKLKIYNAKDIIGKIGNVTKLGEAISGVARKNLELWHLEDEARRKDVDLNFIGEIKRKIDVVNQHRNDFVDKIDELFEKFITENKNEKK